jgi:hypothetical protein
MSYESLCDYFGYLLGETISSDMGSVTSEKKETGRTTTIQEFVRSVSPATVNTHTRTAKQ